MSRSEISLVPRPFVIRTGYGKSLCYALSILVLVFDRLRDCWETSNLLFIFYTNCWNKPQVLCARATIRVLSVSFYTLQRAHCTLFHSVTR